VERLQPNIVVIGGSAGAIRPLREILASLPAAMAVAVAAFVVVHTRPDAPPTLASLLGRAGPLKVKNAEDHETIASGTVLVAPPDRHLVIKEGFVRLIRSPRENLWRPAVDVLFRSAAVAHGSRAIGVILSGALDDGSAGISAIKRCGGTAIVQSPTDAQFSEMPRSAIRSAHVDYVVPHREIAAAIESALGEEPQSRLVPEELVVEAQFAEGQFAERMTGSLLGGASVPALLPPTPGGADSLQAALWAAIRHLEHRANTHWMLASEYKCRGLARAAEIYGQRAHEAQAHADQLRKLLLEYVRSGPVVVA
jgi:two-component system chemotaxis response regulator CheB